MPDRDHEVSETEKLAGTINETIEGVEEILGCVLQGCWWSGLGCLAYGIVGTLIGGGFGYLEAEIGFYPTCVVFIVATWLAVHLYRRHRGGRGGTSP